VRTIGVDERRARLGRRQLLAPSAGVAEPVDVSRALVGVHATDPGSVFLGMRARMRDVTASTIEAALYDARSIVRILGMRRTMFVVPTAEVALIHAATTRAIAVRERKRTVQMLERAGVTDDAAGLLGVVEAATLAAVETRGEALAGEVSNDIPELAIQFTYGEGTKWAGTQGVVTRVLFLLAADGRVARGRPRGTWTSSQHRWAPMSAWLPDGIEELPTGEAQVELVSRWLGAFGPGTVADIKWWTGWTLGETRQAIAGAGAVDVDLEGQVGLVLGDDLDPVAAPEPWVALLPQLDTTPMGWKERDWYLGDHRAPLFDRSGNIGPTIWVDGRIVGGWAQRKDGEIGVRLFEDVGAEATAAIEAEADRLGAWIGGVKVTPRFPTPLQKELSG
jgi:hypothetical protein